MNFSAVVMAGGKSSRMGCDKALLRYRGKPLIQNQLHILLQTGASQVFISAAEPSRYSGFGKVVADLDPGMGPLSGLCASLAYCTCSHLLVLAVDMPLMAADYLKTLISRVQPGKGVVPEIRGAHFEPLAAVYPLEASSLIRKCVQEQKPHLQKMIDIGVKEGLFSIQVVSPSEEVFFTNWNQPSDVLHE